MTQTDNTIPKKRYGPPMTPPVIHVLAAFGVPLEVLMYLVQVGQTQPCRVCLVHSYEIFSRCMQVHLGKKFD